MTEENTEEITIDIDDDLKEILVELIFANPLKSLNQIIIEALEQFLKEHKDD